MIRILLAGLFLSFFSHSWAQQGFHFGVYYSYGAVFNFHPLNDSPFKPSDGSWIAGYCHLDNGPKALGFRAVLAWKNNDMRFSAGPGHTVYNHLNAVELRLQCTMPLSERSYIALGMSPRLILRSEIGLEVDNDVNNGHYTTAGFNGDTLNYLNSAISLTWQYAFAQRWNFALSIDQDMLRIYREDIAAPTGFDNFYLPDDIYINGRITSISAALGFQIR